MNTRALDYLFRGLVNTIQVNYTDSTASYVIYMIKTTLFVTVDMSIAQGQILQRLFLYSKGCIWLARYCGKMYSSPGNE